MLENIQQEVEDLRVKVYSGQSNEDTEKALYEIEQLLFKAMDKQLILSGVSQQSELLKVLEYTRQIKSNPKDIQLIVDKLYVENL
tara:strand:- start:20641 stop:20895 length:255 start_codon:yes stop_codon:yes gene_type:complete